MAVDRVVESSRYPYLHVSFTVRRQQRRVWAYVDTGFDGLLVVPEAETQRLGTPVRTAVALLADGSHIQTPVYMGSVEVLGLDAPVSGRIIAVGSEYILGRAVIDRFRLTFDRGARLIAEV